MRQLASLGVSQCRLYHGCFGGGLLGRGFRRLSRLNHRRMLDDLIQRAVDPSVVWQRTRLRLTQLNLDTKSILLLEDAFVRSVIQEDKEANALSRGLASINVTADVRGIVQSLIASAVFGMFAA